MAPSLQSLVSRRAMANEQGEVLGVNQSASALARVIGPVAAGWAYGALGPGMGFAAGGMLIAIAAMWVRAMREQPESFNDPPDVTVSAPSR
jgi:predicted MFS family arabinose efflux permease